MANKTAVKKSTKKTSGVNPYLEDRAVIILPVEGGKKWKDLVVNASAKEKDPLLFKGVTKRYSLPLNSRSKGGGLMDILDNYEKNYIKEYEEDLTEREYFERFFNADLNPYSRESVFWTEDKRAVIELGEEGLPLNLRKPQDMMKYKIALANERWISPSPESYKTLRRPTQEFVIVDEAKKKEKKVKDMMERVSRMQEFNKHFDDRESMMNILGVAGRMLDPNAKFDQVQATFTDFFEKSPQIFMDIVNDHGFSTKVFITRCVMSGLIQKRGDMYSLDTGEELGRLPQVVNWVKDPQNDAVILRMKGQLKKQ